MIRCPGISTLFSRFADGKEKRLVWEDVDPQIAECFVNFLYLPGLDKVDLDMNQLTALFVLADKYLMNDLATAIVHHAFTLKTLISPTADTPQTFTDWIRDLKKTFSNNVTLEVINIP
jgi:hypothetical protein